MAYLNAWLSLIGWNEAAFLLAVGVLPVLADRFVLWHAAHTDTPPVVARPTDPGPMFMVTGYGETDYPEVVMARDLDAVKDAYRELVFGAKWADLIPEHVTEAEEFRAAVEKHDWDEDSVFSSWQFELGGVKVERVYARQFSDVIPKMECCRGLAPVSQCACAAQEDEDGRIAAVAIALCERAEPDADPHELLYTNGPTPEPWGDRWQRYEDEARTLIAAYKNPKPKAQDERPKGRICVGCDGCGWCEGSPAFKCERCNGTGIVDEQPKGRIHGFDCAQRQGNVCDCGLEEQPEVKRHG